MSRVGRLVDRWANVSLRAKITGVTVFILFLGLVVAGVGTLSVLRPILSANQTNVLTQLRVDPSPALARDADPSSLEPGDVLYANQQYYVALFDANGRLLYDNTQGRRDGTMPQVPHMTLDEVVQRGDQLLSVESKNGTSWRAVTAPITAGGEPRGFLLIADSASWINQTIANYVIVFTGFGIGVILLGAALTRLLVTTTFLPLREVERTALEIARGDYSKRIMVTTPNTEVGHLGESLNVMLDRLDDSLEDREHTIEKMRRFIGDASHELRTPLVSVRGYAELYRMGALHDSDQMDQAMERIEKEAIRMTSLVEDLLALARLDEGRKLDLTVLDLNHLAADAALDAGAQAPDRQVTVTEDPSAPQVLGDEHKVRQIMTNLIGNAMRHTDAGTPIEIVVSSPTTDTSPQAEASAANDTAAPPRISRFEIIDHGEGIPEQVREKIFDRFWRSDNSRNRETGGSGLGLAIVRSIVDAHGGTVRAIETPGGGATFQVDLPAAPTPAPAEAEKDPSRTR